MHAVATITETADEYGSRDVATVRPVTYEGDDFIEVTTDEPLTKAAARELAHALLAAAA
jgi:hypothetical protein